MTINSICIFGGSGFVGRHLTNLLTNEEIQLRVPTRNYERSKDLLVIPTVDLVEVTEYDDDQLDRLLMGMEAVINLTGVLHGDFHDAHVEMPQKIVAACKRNGIDRILHMSALTAGPNQPSAYLRSKAEGERIVMTSGLSATSFRPSIIFGPGDSSINLFARLGRLPVLPLALPDAKFQPIFVENVVQALTLSLDDPKTFGQSYDLCGPKCYRLRELVEYSAHVTGHDPAIIGLGNVLSRLEATVMEILPGKLMSADNYYSMKVDNVCDCAKPSNFKEVWGIQPTELEEVAPLYLARQTPRERLDYLRHWSAGR
jgi:NADH dehydrogenase